MRTDFPRHPGPDLRARRGDGEVANLEAYVAAELSLKDHLAAQLVHVTTDPIDRMIGHALIDSIDDTGYLTEAVADIAERLGVRPSMSNKS